MIRTISALLFATLLVVATPALADPPPIEDYGKLPAMDMVTLSPGGDRYAFIAEVNGVRRLYALTMDNKLIRFNDVGAVKVRGIYWAGDDYIIISISVTTGPVSDRVERPSAFIWNINTGATNPVFDDKNNFSSITYGPYNITFFKGKWYGYFVGFGWGGGGTYRVDIATRDRSPLYLGPWPTFDILINPDGKIVARSLYDTRTFEWRLLTGEWPGQQRDTGEDIFGGPELLGFGRTADSILVSRPGPSESIIEELPLTAGPAIPVSGVTTKDDLLFDPFSQLWIGVVQDGDHPTPTLFDPAQEAKLQGALKAFPGYNVRLASWSADFNHMIMFTDGGDDSGTYWIVDIAKGSATILGSAYPSMNQRDVGPVQMVDWRSGDGWPLRGVLTLPKGRSLKNLPLVVMPHGGPEERDYPGFNYWAQAFASRGYAVFQPNFRGSGGYGQAFRDAGFGEVGRKMQTDISDGVAELAKQGIVDPKRACIVGWSYGGYAAMAGITIQHGLYRCAVSMAGVSDPWKMLYGVRRSEGGNGSVTRYWSYYYGAKSEYDRLASISPTKLAAQADAPILLIHGDGDTVVPIDQTDEMERALKAAGKPVERLTLPGADHWLLEEDSRVTMVKASVAFVEKYNPPDTAPAATVATTPPAQTAPH